MITHRGYGYKKLPKVEISGPWKLWGSTIGLAAALATLIPVFPDYWVLTLGAVTTSAVAYPVYRFVAELRPSPKDIQKYVNENLTFVDVEHAIKALIDMLRSASFVPDIIIGIDRGGAIVAGILGKALGKPITTMTVARRWTLSDSEKSLDEGLKNPHSRRADFGALKNILLVDDACRAGTTLASAFDSLRGVGALHDITIKTAVILNQKQLHPKIEPDFYAYTTEKGTILLPWDSGPSELG